jgi:hypothetical protein
MTDIASEPPGDWTPLAPGKGVFRAAGSRLVVWVLANGEVNIAPGPALLHLLGWKAGDRIAVDWRGADGRLRLRRSEAGFLLQRAPKTGPSAGLRLRLRCIPDTPRRPMPRVTVCPTVLPGNTVEFVPPWVPL